jgi:hypothetical protein
MTNPFNVTATGQRKPRGVKEQVVIAQGVVFCEMD